MTDPYQTLGVARDATQEAIRKAYLRLAKSNHPDLHPGDNAAEARFKEISAANDIVGDEKKRAQFDSGEIDEGGATRPPQPTGGSYRRHAEEQSDFKYERYWDGADREDGNVFAELFSRHRDRAQARGQDIAYTFAVGFIDAINGAKKRIVMADGKALDITIPAGLRDGQTLRLRGQGHPGHAGAAPGDALVEIHVEPHSLFRRDHNTIRSTLPVTIGEALAGARLRVATVSGDVELAVPKGSNAGTILRLRGKGVPSPDGNGDHLVELRVVLPDAPDDDLVRCVTDWEAKHPYDPRATGVRP